MYERAWCEVRIKSGMCMEHVGWGLPQFDYFFHDLAAVAIIAVAQAPPSRICWKWPRMDEIAWYNVRIKSGDVIGVCERGFVAVDVDALFSGADDISFGNGWKWVKLHSTGSE